MLDNGLNQGVGLQRIAPRTPLRLVALASHGDKASELPLLWNLCSTWIGLGYPVAVLDMTADETEANPGLRQILDGSYWDDSAHSGTSWAVLPARQGMEHLLATHAALPLEQLPTLFPEYEIVLVYAPTDLIVALFQDTPISPLIALSSQPQALLTAYQSTKQLLLEARLHPTIVSVLEADDPYAPDDVSQSLRNCALNFLGEEVSTLTARTGAPGSAEEMKRLVLRLLENAAVLHPPLPPQTPARQGHARKH